ncbi:two-component system, OmpR family, sensor histidine kinase PfeS [Halopseudomonas xinjiangensis]|uniref:histidine kinase n=1 Tax=Halopseudomonas xinjiangensis TaxID=487184 RepID=A0A1H1XQN2_9GAMM|nr:sensor histidine kinase [Halopseudomonas xinjiangensis]SDT11119.1 two-component system, OmpR family, sensor histidine kinase PfeS [Halopseudomonas xinjiangensis]
MGAGLRTALADRLMPRRHSLFWRMVLLVAGFCLVMIAATDYLTARIDRVTSYLSPRALETLGHYGEQARAAMQIGSSALDDWRARMAVHEPVWLTVVDDALEPLGDQRLNSVERHRLTFVRDYRWPMSLRSPDLPLVSVPLGDSGAHLIMRLPERFRPWKNRALSNALVLYLLPVCLSMLLCALLYWLLISPLERLRRQASALRANRLEALLPASMAGRRDELGELGRALEYLTRRLRDSVIQQRQLLQDLSHELRTPLSRLRVASETDLALVELRERLERETDAMQRLVDNTLKLAWLDSDEARVTLEPIDIALLWDVLREDALFESGWPEERLESAVPAECKVMGDVNGLAQVLENVLRNAIRHSPPNGRVRLAAARDGPDWCLSMVDQGGGVAEEHLSVMFRPFTRLSPDRPGGSGFGLGLSIAASMIRLQRGQIWAENTGNGLRVTVRLKAV